jgi:hypothetical protein
MPRLPRFIESDPRREALEALLARDARPLWAKGTLPVAHVPYGAPLQRALGDALNQRQLERGLENIEAVLGREQKGLDVRRLRSGSGATDRTSRLLVIADDGSERFYRECEALLVRYADRVLGLRVDAPPGRLAGLFGPDALIKVLLVSERASVVPVLLSLVDQVV